MNLSTLPRDIINHIIKYLSIKSCISLRSVSRRFRGYLQVVSACNFTNVNNIFCLIANNDNFIIPNNLKILHIDNYEQLLNKKIPVSLKTIVIKSLCQKEINYGLLNVKNIYIDYLYFYGNLILCEYIDLRKLDKIKYLNTSGILQYFLLPKTIKKIKCKAIYTGVVNLDCLECSYVDIFNISYVKTLKIIYDEKYKSINLPICQTLIIVKKPADKLYLQFNNTPDEIIYN